LDLSLAGAQALHMTTRGTDEIQLEVVRYIGNDPGKSLLKLQVASFADMANAQAVADRLRPTYSDVKIVASTSSAGPRYRVQAGRYHTLTQAKAAGEQLRRLTGTDPLIIREDE
jgi:rare lipoprotein A (peptidoglycan hydrolase)